MNCLSRNNLIRQAAMSGQPWLIIIMISSPQIFSGDTSSLARIGSRRPGMTAENICIRPSSSTIAQDNMTLRWMSGVLKRNLSDGSEQPTSKLQVSFFSCCAFLTFLETNTFFICRRKFRHPFSQCNGVLHCCLGPV